MRVTEARRNVRLFVVTIGRAARNKSAEEEKRRVERTGTESLLHYKKLSSRIVWACFTPLWLP